MKIDLTPSAVYVGNFRKDIVLDYADAVLAAHNKHIIPQYKF